MKSLILKIAKTKDIDSFYKKFPDEESFMKIHGKEFKKAQLGAKMSKAFNGEKTPPYRSENDEFMNSVDASANDDYQARYMAAINSPYVNNNLMSPKTGQLAISNKPSPSIKGLNVNPIDKLGGPMGIAQTAGGLLGGIQALGAEKKKRQSAEQWRDVSGLQLQASQTQEELPLRKYVRPDINTGEEFFPIYGSGTEPLARNGMEVSNRYTSGNPSEISNTYAPNTLYDDLEYIPQASNGFIQGLNSFASDGGTDFAKRAITGLGGENAGGDIGGSIGQAAGSIIGGPLGGMVGQIGGQLIGGLLDRNPHKIKEAQDQTNRNIGMMVFGNMPKNAYMENGGWMNPEYNPQVITKFGDHSPEDVYNFAHENMRTGGNIRQNFSMGGDLQVYKGDAEPISNNPYGGETVMFRGPSHADGGMPISYGGNPVEVEGGEPAVKLQDGGGQDNLVVFGNLNIPKGMLGDAKGKFKNYIAKLSKTEEKQNNIINRSTSKLADLNIHNPYDKLTLASLQANIMGANMKLKDAEIKKQDAAALQDAINKTAEEQGLVAEHLSKGNIKMAKQGINIKAQDGITKYPNAQVRDRYTIPGDLVEPAWTHGFAPSVGAYQIIPENVGRDAYSWSAGSAAYKARGFTNYFPPDENSWRERTPEEENAASLQTIPSRGKTSNTVSKAKQNKTSNIPIMENSPQSTGIPINYVQEAINKSMGNYSINKVNPYSFDYSTGKRKESPSEEDKKPFNWMNVANEFIPYLRPSDKEELDPRQLMGEKYAMSQNQLEPIPTQQFQPQLTTPYNVSLNDQMATIDAQGRAAIKTMGNNPAAQAQIMAQISDAKNKIAGEQFRMNQQQQAQTYGKNIDLINQSKLQNLGMMEKQYEKQTGAKANTKALTQAALSSISDKFLKNKLENRSLQTYENLYNYRFDPQFRTQNMNPLFQPTISTVAGGDVNNPPKAIEASKKVKRNGAIVKAIKNL